MNTTLDGHKKMLGILYVVTGALSTVGMLILMGFLSVIFTLATAEADPEDQKVMEMVGILIQYLPIVVIIFFSIPSLIAGIALLMRKSWATLFALIIGCLKLFSFPIGTALGSYSIWIYIEEQKLKKISEFKQ
jgi:hypothetical protein